MYEMNLRNSARDGWKAETTIPMDQRVRTGMGHREGDRVLHLSTFKSSNGSLVSSAMVAVRGDDGCQSFMIGSDFNKTILRTRVRCTEKAVREQHAQMLAQADAIKGEALAFYAAREDKVAA